MRFFFGRGQHIALGNHPHQAAVAGNDGNMPYVVLGHELPGLRQTVVGAKSIGFGGHDLGDAEHRGFLATCISC